MSTSNTTKSKQSKVTKVEAMVAGIQKYFDSATTLLLDNQNMNKVALVALLQAYVTAVTAVAAVKAQLASAVRTQDTADASIQTVLTALTSYVRGLYGNEPAILADFGLKPLTRQKPTAKVAAQAVDLRAETRKLRNTMGSKQRQDVKATPSPATPPGPAATGTGKPQA